jgi:hypothetical protein
LERREPNRHRIQFFEFYLIQPKPFASGNLKRSVRAASNLLDRRDAFRQLGNLFRHTVLFQSRVGFQVGQGPLALSRHALDQRLIIVRRGQFALFELLVRTFADDPHVQVVWDRRLADRRCDVAPTDGDDRRRADRRGRAPSQWRELNYMIAETARPGERPA